MTIPNNANEYLPGVIQIPSSIVITAITQAFPMVITVSVNALTEANTYIQGQLVKLNIPITYGMFQANGLEGQVLSVVGNNITVDIDARYFDTFSVPGSGTLQPAMISPSGSRNLEFSNATNLIGFQSLNNVGN